MTPDTDPSDGPTTAPEFERRLFRLVREAHENGVDVEGGWADRNGDPDRPDWGVEIYEVVDRAADEHGTGSATGED